MARLCKQLLYDRFFSGFNGFFETGWGLFELFFTVEREKVADGQHTPFPIVLLFFVNGVVLRNIRLVITH